MTFTQERADNWPDDHLATDDFCGICGEPSPNSQPHPWCVEAERDQQLREDLDRWP